jgi:hypothetical protein
MTVQPWRLERLMLRRSSACSRLAVAVRPPSLIICTATRISEEHVVPAVLLPRRRSRHEAVGVGPPRPQRLEERVRLPPRLASSASSGHLPALSMRKLLPRLASLMGASALLLVLPPASSDTAGPRGRAHEVER